MHNAIFLKLETGYTVENQIFAGNLCAHQIYLVWHKAMIVINVLIIQFEFIEFVLDAPSLQNCLKVLLPLIFRINYNTSISVSFFFKFKILAYDHTPSLCRP